MTKCHIKNKIKQAEKELARMNKKRMAAEVIAAQEKVVEDYLARYALNITLAKKLHKNSLYQNKIKKQAGANCL